MAGVLLVLVCAVLLLGWALAGIALVASLVSIIPRLLDSPGTSTDDNASTAGRWHASDKKFLHDVGIRP